MATRPVERPPQPNLRDRHTAATRQRIIDAATRMFITRGYATTTVDEIAADADVSPRTFFRYFPTKEAVLFHDIDERLDQFQHLLVTRPAEEPPIVALVRSLCAMVEDLEATPDRLRLLELIRAERVTTHESQRAAIAEDHQRIVLVTLADRSGISLDDVGLRAAVTIVLAAFDLAVMTWIDSSRAQSFRRTFADILRTGQTHLEPVWEALSPTTP
jgi:AcrR family transcriptional regulator